MSSRIDCKLAFRSGETHSHQSVRQSVPVLLPDDYKELSSPSHIAYCRMAMMDSSSAVQGITYAVQSIRVSDVLPHLCVHDNFSLSVDDQDRCFFCIVAFHDEIVSQVITFLESYITLLGKSPQSTNNCCFIPSTSRMVIWRSLRFPLSIRKGNP